MPLPLPSLDTRRWNDLVEEARALIPRYAPAWTDHNVHDPGITLVELLAWLVEMDIYQLNRVPAAHKRKFLALVGVRPRGAHAARAVLGIAPTAPVDIPAGAEFLATSTDKKTYRFRADGGVHALPASLAAALVQESAVQPPRASLKSWTESGTIAPFGLEPKAGAAFWLGFEQPFAFGEAVQFAAALAGERHGWDERQRIVAEGDAQAEACRRPAPRACADAAFPQADTSVPREDDAREGAGQDEVLRHHSARLVWEYYTASGWQLCDPETGDLYDNTRALTLNGVVRLTIRGTMALLDAGDGRPRYYVRARLASGEYDTPAILRRLSINGLPVVQAIPVSAAFSIAPGVAATGTPNDRPRFAFDDQLAISQLEFTTDAPEIPVRYFRAATAAEPGILIAEMAAIGRGSGQPNQRFTLKQPWVQGDSLRVFSYDAASGWQAWTRAPDFDAATGRDAAFSLDGLTVAFGDGDHGRMPPDGAFIFAAYRATAAGDGSVRAGQITTLAPSLANWLLLNPADFESVVTDISALQGDFATLWQALSPASYAAAAASLGTVTNLDPAQGGAPAEPLTHATGRAVAMLQAPTRAITAGDYTALALETPGTAIARVHVLAGQHPAYPCLKAPGVVTVIVVPAGRGTRPLPSAGLLDAVRRYLNRRRIVGTYIEVVAPSYVTVQARARVQALPGVSASRVQADITAALNAFLNPLTGGPAAIQVPAQRAAVKPTSAPVPASIASLAPLPPPEPTLRPSAPLTPGWPFGRDVYRSEILQVIDGVPGVDNVLSLTLIGDGEASDCGNLCVGAAQLVVPGEHSIEVVP